MGEAIGRRATTFVLRWSWRLVFLLFLLLTYPFLSNLPYSLSSSWLGLFLLLLLYLYLSVYHIAPLPPLFHPLQPLHPLLPPPSQDQAIFFGVSLYYILDTGKLKTPLSSCFWQWISYHNPHTAASRTSLLAHAPGYISA